MKLSEADCMAARSDESWGFSKKYVGKGQQAGGEAVVYSFPAATECTAGASLGSGGCTWKRHNFFRLAQGKGGMTESQVKSAFSAGIPLKPWSCDANGGSGVGELLLV